MDSVVASHVSIRWGWCDVLVYLDTGVGAEPNKRFVERVADEFGVPLLLIRTPESYEERVREHGFPGESRHSIMYRSLKERQIGKLATLCDGRGNASELYLWTGVRRQESERRMDHVERIQEADRWTWIAPIYNWSDAEVRRYHARRSLPTNYLWRTLGRSADCFCGAFGAKEELIDAEACGCNEVVRDMRRLEDEIDGTWSVSPSETELRADRAEEDDKQMMLCESCGRGD